MIQEARQILSVRRLLAIRHNLWATFLSTIELSRVIIKCLCRTIIARRTSACTLAALKSMAKVRIWKRIWGHTPVKNLSHANGLDVANDLLAQMNWHVTQELTQVNHIFFWSGSHSLWNTIYSFWVEHKRHIFFIHMNSVTIRVWKITEAITFTPHLFYINKLSHFDLKIFL